MKKVLTIIKNIIGFILFLLSFVIAGLIPFEALFYKTQKPAAESSSGVGLPAGEGIIRTETVEEMKMHDYFTFQTDSMTPTGIFCIIDPKDGGTKTGGTRKNPSIWTVPFHTTGRIYPIMHKLTYGQFYIASLPNGENVVVLVNNALIPTSGNKIRTLPVGEIKNMPSGSMYGGNLIESYFKTNSEKYGLGDNTSWYVRMVSDSFKENYKTPVFIIQIILTIIIAVILIILLNKLFSLFGIAEED